MSKRNKKNRFAKRQVQITPEQLMLASRGGTVAGGGPATWMSPGQPPLPQHQDIKGRQFDYAPGTNQNFVPRVNEAIDFVTLRQLADGYDLMRLVIDTRKDQLCKMDFEIVSKDDEADVGEDSRVEQVRAILDKPDRVHSWQAWLRMLVEDQLVIDAATIYPHKTLGGGLYSLDIIDGSTIKVVINKDGRRPVAPAPAYQQVIKGIPSVNYTADELIYVPRNVRSWKLYGQSPVEQVIMTVNIALRRQIHQLQYYTEGNIPEALMSVPEDWGPEQVAQMQNIWDTLLEGNTAQRRHVKFIPGAQKITFTKDQALKDEYDEWLARIVCFAFSISPTPFVKQTNRATAESAHEAALSEGLGPLMQWVKDLMDFIIEKYLGFADLQFKWKDQKDLDPKSQAEIHQIYLQAGAITVDEVRNDIGKDPIKSEQGAPPSADQSEGAVPGNAPQSTAASGAVPVVPGLAGPGSSNPSGAASSVQNVQNTAMNGAQVTALIELMDTVAAGNLPADTARAIAMAAFPAVHPDLIDEMINGLKNFEQPVPEPPIIAGPLSGATGSTPPAGAPKPPAAGAEVKPVPKPVAKAASRRERETKKLASKLNKALHKTGLAIAAQVVKHRKEPDQAGKATGATPTVARLDFSDMQDAEGDLSDAIETVASGAAADGLLEVAPDSSSRLTNLANSRAERWAAQHSTKLISADAHGGELIDATRDMIKSTIIEAEEKGWSNAMLKTALEDNYAFSAQRAEVIARTELKMADGAGNMIGYRASGVVSAKEWETSESDACDECLGNESDGVVPLDDSFSSGDDTVPAHPNCNCSVTPVLADEGDESDSTTTDEES